MRRSLLLWGPVVAYMGVIYAVSSRPLPPGLLAGRDWMAHLAEYAVLGLLLARALRGKLARIPLRLAVITWLVATLYGVSDEFHQSFVPGRDPSVEDVTMDSLGAGAVALALWRVGRWR